MAYIILLGIIKLQAFFKLVVKFVGRGLNIYVKDLTNHEKCIVDILRYIKNYQGDVVRSTGILKNYRFSDEREWRYIPDYNHDFSMIAAADEIISEDHKKALQEKLNGISLSFEPNDIKYIIIKNDLEISEFLNILRNDKGKNYSHHDIERLMTRILTTEQIVSDI